MYECSGHQDSQHRQLDEQVSINGAAEFGVPCIHLIRRLLLFFLVLVIPGDASPLHKTSEQERFSTCFLRMLETTLVEETTPPSGNKQHTLSAEYHSACLLPHAWPPVTECMA